ncbi:hypothetical protein NQ315_005512 [Exocentrus adspersus]|uniref:Uncharacterized protein n=1 Tax=Exocentrus adspersus TaxID=1586481 RepID=A0AAV8VU83_9CUCU|nr:hypothetical protein NQ315_005512 [Exocentrus adspersus]
MGLQLTTSQITGSLTNLPNTTANAISKSTLTSTNSNPVHPSNPATHNSIDDKTNSSNNPNPINIQTNKVYETDIL